MQCRWGRHQGKATGTEKDTSSSEDVKFCWGTADLLVGMPGADMADAGTDVELRCVCDNSKVSYRPQYPVDGNFAALRRIGGGPRRQIRIRRSSSANAITLFAGALRLTVSMLWSYLGSEQ